MSHIARNKKKANVRPAYANNPRFNEFADHVISPGSGKPSIAPSLCPSRAGSVNFPLVVEISGLTDFAIIAQPDINNPLMITHVAAIPESNEPIGGSLDKDLIDDRCLINVQRGCAVESILLDGYPAIPLTSAAGATLTARVAISDGDDAAYDCEFWIYDGGWNLAAAAVSIGVAFGQGAVASSVAFSATATAFGFRMRPTNSLSIGGGTSPGTAHGTFSVVFEGVTTGTCSTGGLQNVFDVHLPEWDKVLSVADKVSIPYMDCLVTYQGSTLNNQGAIAAAATSEEIVPKDGEYYSAIASRPFDMYEGRLASQGETEGGAHWHLLHDDVRAYSLTASENLITGPRGYIAIKGMDSAQPVRVVVHITLNYYTLDPSFSMQFQPPWGELDLLLYTLRTQVPLVSSNDKHLDKIKRLATRKAKEAAKWALNNPEEAIAMALSAAQVAGSLLV